MNTKIFSLDPFTSASFFFNAHIRNSIPLYTQALSTCYHLTGKPECAPYKENHTMANEIEFCMDSWLNWSWMLVMTLGMCKEYEKQFGKKHSCEKVLYRMAGGPHPNIPDNGFVWESYGLAHHVGGALSVNAWNYLEKNEAKFDYGKREIPIWMMQNYVEVRNRPSTRTNAERGRAVFIQEMAQSKKVLDSAFGLGVVG